MDFCKISFSEAPSLYPLLGKCFACWTKYGKDDPFPFEITSFAAVENGRFAAHCGIVKFTVSDGAGGLVTLGGLANVCTDPEFRHQGLAEKLCRMAIDFARKEKFAGIPLFTSFERVYEKNGWWNYPIFMPKLARWKKKGSPNAMRQGCALTEAEKRAIVLLYEKGFDFPGKVVRGNETSPSLFSWRHHWEKFEFATDGLCYAAGGGNLVCELNGSLEQAEEFLLTLPRENDATIFVLPENSPFWGVIGKLADLEKSDIFFHGPMVVDLDGRNFFAIHRNLYFPLTDRF